jgi:hypothetical protein
MASGALNIVVSNLVFATTNGQKLPLYGSLPDPTSTNNQPFNLIWNTNGNPCSIAYSNLINGMVGYLGTNKLVPYVWTEVFSPYNLYSTNNGLTNIWGWTNVAAITNLYFGTNSLPFTNNTLYPALTNTDRLPIQSELQHSNTTVTLEALRQWMQTNSFVSSYVGTNTNGLSAGVFTFAHGLGVVPKQVRAVLLCVTNDGTFKTNEELSVEGVIQTGSSSPNYSVKVNVSNITVVIQGANGRVHTNTAISTLTDNRWWLKTYASP